MGDVLALLIASLAVMGSPGPSTVSATAMGAAYGIARSLPYVGGLVAGTSTVLLAVALGVIAMVASVPQAAPVLVGAAGLYILYLAYQIATAPPLQADAGTTRAPAFIGGYLLAVANPKAWLAIAAVFASAPRLGAGLRVVVLVGMIVLIHAVWLGLGAALARVLRRPVASRIINVGLAVAMVVLTAVALIG